MSLPQPSTRSSLTEMILKRVRADLASEPPIYTSPAKLAAEMPEVTKHMVAEVCCRYLRDEEKDLRKGVQPVGRRWPGYRQNKH